MLVKTLGQCLRFCLYFSGCKSLCVKKIAMRSLSFLGFSSSWLPVYDFSYSASFYVETKALKIPQVCTCDKLFWQPHVPWKYINLLKKILYNLHAPCQEKHAWVRFSKNHVLLRMTFFFQHRTFELHKSQCILPGHKSHWFFWKHHTLFVNLYSTLQKAQMLTVSVTHHSF